MSEVIPPHYKDVIGPVSIILLPNIILESVSIILRGVSLQVLIMDIVHTREGLHPVVDYNVLWWVVMIKEDVGENARILFRLASQKCVCVVFGSKFGNPIELKALSPPQFLE